LTNVLVLFYPVANVAWFSGDFAMNAYRLASGAVECGFGGLFVGGVALLSPGANAEFAPRAIDLINDELSQRYGAEIDATSRLAGLKFVASCLKSGDLPRAQIGALMLRFPDPPQTLAKGQQGIEHWGRLEAMLDAAGLLKVSVWDPSKHPRLGAPPNRGWFAPTDPATRWLRQTSGQLVRWVEVGAAFGHLALVVAEKSFDLFSLVDYGSSFLEDSRLLPSTGDPVADEIESFNDPPKTPYRRAEPSQYREATRVLEIAVGEIRPRTNRRRKQSCLGSPSQALADLRGISIEGAGRSAKPYSPPSCQ
jgi:hypothetical protein